MMNEPIETLLAKCMKRMEAGASLESCLADYPKEAAELESLLRTALQMKALTEVGPRSEYARQARLQIENQLLSSGKVLMLERSKRSHLQQQRPARQRNFRMSAFQFIVAAVLAFIAATGGVVVYAAQASSPGSPLYGVELAMENARVNLTPDVPGKVKLRIEFANKRLTEAEAAFSKNNTADGIEAVKEYDAEISGAAQLIGSARGADQLTLTSLLKNAQNTHVQMLTSLLATVPDQAKGVIQNALDVDKYPSSSVPDSNTNGAGKPDDQAPNGVGTPGGPNPHTPHATPPGKKP